MKRFLRKILLFAIGIYALAWGLDTLVCKGLLRMDDYRFQDYKAMLEGGMDNEILIIGNSRGKSHSDTSVVDSLSGLSSFNIGIGGYPINVQLAKYQLYREHNRKPDIIIQNIDYSTVKVFHDIHKQHESEQFFPLVYDPEMRKTLKDLGYSFIDLNVPLYRMFGYQQVVKNGLLEVFRLKHYISRPSHKGFLPENGSWDGSEWENMNPEQVVLSEEGKVFFESFLDQCNKDSVQVILVNSPMFFGAQEKLIGYPNARSYFEQVAERFGCLYLDAGGCFCVSVHLNSKAAKQFTETLCNDLRLKEII